MSDEEAIKNEEKLSNATFRRKLQNTKQAYNIKLSHTQIKSLEKPLRVVRSKTNHSVNSSKQKKAGIFYDSSLDPSKDNKILESTLSVLEDKKGHLLENFDKLSEAAQASITQIVNADLAGKFTPPVEREPSIYDQRLEGETVEDFIRRVHPGFPDTWNKRKDGDIIPFLIKHFRLPDMDFIDGCRFHRSILGRLNKKAAEGLNNYLRENKFPDDFDIPTKPESGQKIVENLFPEELSAAITYYTN